MRRKKPLLLTTFALLSILSVLIFPTSAPALTFKSAPATQWGYIYASPKSSSLSPSTPSQHSLTGLKKSEWRITFNDVPADARAAIQYAVDIWSENFSSKTPINVDAGWETYPNNQVLASARPGYYFNAFPGSPDDDLWYPSALANSLAGRDLDTTAPEIVLRVNSTPLWYTGTDGRPGSRSYDLASVVLHEIGHGLGFLSNAEYDPQFGTGYMYQPTPFDAYVQTKDGRYLADFCSRSIDLGKAMTTTLLWSGDKAITANKNVKPKLYAPAQYLDGSSITHLDEETFRASSTDALMTPLLEPGESFNSPGPIALAMIEDMLQKPPLSPATDLPQKPVNVRALVGDKYALLTFDSPNCRRINKINDYTVTINPSGTTKKYDSSPIRITGLTNGKSYTFTLTANNDKGSSDAVTSNSIKPQVSGKTTTIDPTSQVEYLAAAIYQKKQAIIYGDAKTNSIKMATLSGTKWKITTVKKNISVGPISICTSGTGTKEQLHLFYADTASKDLKYSLFSSGKWKSSTVDGDGESVQDYKEQIRVKTASDVSVSNACAVTTAGIQVFYRDETQGILLGAVKTSTGWVYEIVDGDQRTDGRTTGDVAFHLSATTVGKSVYLLYDSVLIINSSKTPTSGEVRLASRNSIYSEDWKYQTLDGPDNNVAVAGYATAIHANGKKITAAWLSANGNSLPNADQLRYTEISEANTPSGISTDNYGTPSAPLAIDSKGFAFGCSSRLCVFSPSASSLKLATGTTTNSNYGTLITIKGDRYLATSLKGKLLLIKL